MKNSLIKIFGIFLFILMLKNVLAQEKQGKNSTISINAGEHWWAGIVNQGHQMPFTGDERLFDLTKNGYDNQSAPFLISDKGRFIWSGNPFRFSINQQQITIYNAPDDIKVDNTGKTLAEAYKILGNSHFPASGKWVDSLLITSPQYNLWIELLYNPNQADVLKYANTILDKGWPAGVLMIDDNWTRYYGEFELDRVKFPNPEQMCAELHSKGFKVMLWVCPFITADSPEFRELAEKKLLLLDSEGRKDANWENTTKPLLIKWWNGYSAHLDLTNPDAVKWLKDKLNYLTNRYGIDGYKFDAGDAVFFTNPNLVSYDTSSPQDLCYEWSKIGLDYKLNEYRASWKMGGQPLVQRLRDKLHNWEDLQKLVPHTIVQQLMGYQFVCPDMIGGGDYISFLPGNSFDQKLVVRSAQCSALMPMMQFSVAPWRVLDSLHFKAVDKIVKLRQQFVPYIMQLMHESVQTGGPIVKSLEFEFPGQGFHNITNQFLLGDRFMVAPVITSHDSREVVFPKGIWKYRNETIKGPAQRTFEVGLDELLIFEKVK